MNAQQTDRVWLARKKFYGADGNFTPYISEGDTATVLCFMNLSGAYNGFAGCEQANKDAKLMAAAPALLQALKTLLAANARLSEAMKDGANVHGALSFLHGATDNANEVIAKVQATQAA